MPSLLAIYNSPIADVLRQWNEAAPQLGLELVAPITEDGEPWECVRLNGDKIYLQTRMLHECDLMPGCAGSVWVDVWGASYDECTEMLPKVLELPLKATEVVAIFDKDCVFCFGTYALSEATPEQLVEQYDSDYVTESIHSLRAFHRDLLGDPERWRAEAHERGLGWNEVGEYGVLDVYWDQRGKWRDQDSPDLLTGVPSERAIFDHLPLDPDPPHMRSLEPLPERAPYGTLFMVHISEVASNPTRAPEPWRDASTRTARILEGLVSKDIFLGRWYSIRRFALICPGLTKADHGSLLQTIRDELDKGFADAANCAKGYIYATSWPEDGETQSTIWDQLWELERRMDGTPFGWKQDQVGTVEPIL